MSPRSRLLICEMLVEPLHRQSHPPKVGPGEHEIGNAPELLPANYGDVAQFRSDFMMMTNLQGKERNHSELSELVKLGGLTITRFWTLAGINNAILECRLP